MRSTLASAALAAAVLPSFVLAAPTAVPYVGYLVYDNGGTVHSSMNISVQVYSSDVGGDSLWGPHLFESVPVVNGVFTLLLGGGSSPDLAPALDSGQPLWLQFVIDSEALTPRQQVLSVPFARRAEIAMAAGDAALLGGEPASSFATTASLPPAALSGSFADLTDVPADLAQASGTAGRIPRFAGPTTFGDSIVVESDGKLGVN